MRNGILAVIGTRPEAVKMAPIVLRLRRELDVRVQVVLTAQHRDLLDNTLASFGIRGDFDLDVMKDNQSLSTLTARVLDGFEPIIGSEQPGLIVAQGDTTTVLAAALSSFYLHVPFAHVEAGLRTGNLEAPFPEEMNRVMVSRIATLHFAPTQGAADNLFAEGCSRQNVIVTGNTVIDALEVVASADDELPVSLHDNARLVLVTCHRRENFGAPFEQIASALLQIAEDWPDIQILYPVHPNPNIRVRAEEYLGGHPRIVLCPPLGYAQFVAAMKRSFLILTDSGGIQEEAPALGKPVLVLRDTTERPEATRLGVAKIVGTERRTIVAEVSRLLTDRDSYEKMARGISPYGDGLASERIVAAITNSFEGRTIGDGLTPFKEPMA